MNEKCPLEAGVMKQTGEDVKRIGSGDKAHALSLSFYITEGGNDFCYAYRRYYLETYSMIYT